AESAGDGEGSRFTVALPLLDSPAAAGRGVGRDDETAAAPGMQTAVPVEPMAPAAGDTSGISLLLVEDNPDAREMTAELLRACGYHVTACPIGDAPLQAARAGKYEVAVIDIGLPDISGYEVARQLRQAP